MCPAILLALLSTAALRLHLWRSPVGSQAVRSQSCQSIAAQVPCPILQAWGTQGVLLHCPFGESQHCLLNAEQHPA